MPAEAAAKILEPDPEPGGSGAPCQLEGINTWADGASGVWEEAHRNPEVPWAAGDLPRDPRAGKTDECLSPMGPWLGGSVLRRQLSVGRKPHPTPTLKQHALPGASWWLSPTPVSYTAARTRLPNRLLLAVPPHTGY